ncbi:MAG: hypothetical protein ACOYO1_14375 [Bacteroidales bacterium]
MLDKIPGKILSQSQENKNIIGIRKYNDGDNLYIGFIVNYNEKFIVLQHISKYGIEDGLIIEQIENIESIETDTEYLTSYQLLFSNANKIEKQSIRTIELNEDENWQFELLKTRFDHGKIITIELNNEDQISHGYILDFDENYIQINTISDVGIENGTQIFKLADITAFSVDRMECRKREAMFLLNLNSSN